MKLSQDELERHRAAEHLRAQLDAADLIATAKVARQEGMEKGVLIGRIQLFQQLLKQPETPPAELSQLPAQDLLQLEESLKQQLSGPKDANGTPPVDQT